MIDALAFEPHFVDHLAPVWEALPPEARGTFYYMGRQPCRDVAGIVRSAPPKASTRTLVASAGDLFKARKLGRTVALMEHGAGQSYGGSPLRGRHSSYAGGESRDAALFLHPGPHPAGRDRERYPAARIEVIGSPRLDALPRKPVRDGTPVVAVSFHWNCILAPETHSGSAEFQRSVRALAAAPGLRVIGHGHPRIIDRLGEWYARHGIEVVPSFDEVCRRADLYMVDNSSTLFEFAATGRPVVVLNPTFYRRKVHHGLRFWEAATIGIQATSRDDLAAVARAALADPPEQQEARRRALDLVYAYCSGAAQRAAAALLDWAA